MKKIITCFFALAWSMSAYSFQCSQEDSIEYEYKKAEHVFLAYILDTRLEVDLLEQTLKKSPRLKNSDESIKLVSAGYQIVEEFKGKNINHPRLLDVLGIGTGYVGLTPGMYYVVFLPKPSPELPKGIQVVNICNVPLSHYRLHEAGFQNSLNQVRALKRTQTNNAASPNK